MSKPSVCVLWRLLNLNFNDLSISVHRVSSFAEQKSRDVSRDSSNLRSCLGESFSL